VLASQIVIVGLVDVAPKAAEALARDFGLADVRIGSDLEQVVIATQAEAVFDVVIPAARFGVVTTALRLGCHVLSEKPMAASMDEARGLLEAAREAGRIHAVVQNRRYIAGIRRIRRFIESGAIGELTGIHCDFFIGAHFGGFREDMDHVLLLDMAIHTFDAARFVSGQVPLTVFCQESNPKGSWYRHGAAANAMFQLSDGATFTYRGSWCAEGANTSWESAWRITGTQGTLLWDGAEDFSAHRVAGPEGFLRPVESLEVAASVPEEETLGHRSVIEAFIAAIASGRPPETASNDNIKSLAMVFGAIESAETGRLVSLVEG
jgi:predicted dehydrogenase